MRKRISIRFFRLGGVGMTSVKSGADPSPSTTRLSICFDGQYHHQTSSDCLDRQERTNGSSDAVTMDRI
eukprot:904462-Amorphochlora_amoeboformis.AAC.1